MCTQNVITLTKHCVRSCFSHYMLKDFQYSFPITQNMHFIFTRSPAEL